MFNTFNRARELSCVEGGNAPWVEGTATPVAGDEGRATPVAGVEGTATPVAGVEGTATPVAGDEGTARKGQDN